MHSEGLYSGEKNEYLKSLNQYKLLIIDDLGVERDTSYALETVYLVIDERGVLLLQRPPALFLFLAHYKAQCSFALRRKVW